MYFPGCRDIDECRDGSHTCTPPNHICSNTEGDCKKEHYTNSKNLHISILISLLLSAATLVSRNMIYSRIYYTIWCNISNAKPYYQGVLTATRAPSQESVFMERVEQSQGLYQSDTHGVNAKKKDTKTQIMALGSVLTSLCYSENFSKLCPLCQKDQPCHSTFIVRAFSTCIRRFEVHKYIIHTFQYNSTPLWNLKMFEYRSLLQQWLS